VWLEANLLKRWWQGAASFRAGVRRLVELGTAPGVVGFKIADELGYGDAVQQHPACLRAFVRDSVRALHRASPHSQVLIDLVVPDLGCVPGVRTVSASNVRCEAANDARYPGLTLPQVDRLLAMKAVDVVDLSTGLLDESTYRGWHLDAARAQRAAWREVRRRQWSRHVTLNGRKALAHPGNYTGSAETAAGSASVFVDTPL